MKTIIAVIFLVFAIIIGMSVIDRQQKVFENSLYGTQEISQEEETSEAEEKVTVNITGEVQKPGKYTIAQGSFLDDVIEKAGGITSAADTDCFSFYLEIEKDMSIYIPATSNEEKVSLNYSNMEDLMTLQGVGKTIAGRIVTYREENGNFLYLEQVMEVEGIGQTIFSKIKDNICL